MKIEQFRIWSIWVQMSTEKVRADMYVDTCVCVCGYQIQSLYDYDYDKFCFDGTRYKSYIHTADILDTESVSFVSHLCFAYLYVQSLRLSVR